MSTVLTQPADESQGRVRPEELFCAPKVLRRVHRHPDAPVAKSAEAAGGGELRKGPPFVAAPPRKGPQRLVAEHIGAAAHPVRKLGRLLEAGDGVIVSELHDAEG